MPSLKSPRQLARWLSARDEVVTGRKVARRVVQELRLHDPIVHQVMTGPSRQPSGISQQIHYLGRSRFAADLMVFFARAANDANIAIAQQGKVTYWDLLRRHPDRLALPAGADMYVVDRLTHLAAVRGPIFAPFVEANLPVAKDMDTQLAQVRSKGHRRKLQGALKRGLKWRQSRSAADFDLFYDQMYAPFVAERFAFDRSIVARADMRRVFDRKGFLLLCEHEQAPVSGAMMYVSPEAPKTLAYWKYGLRDASELSPAAFGERNASTEAMVLAFAVDKGFDNIDFGLTRGLSDDGIFAHKKRIGCDFSPPKDPPALFDFTLAPTSAAGLLAATPILMMQGSALVGWAGHVGELSEAAAAQLAEQLRGMVFAGLAGITLFVAQASMPSLKRLGEVADALGQEHQGLRVTLQPSAG